MILDRYNFKPIYLQLAENMHADITSGKYSPDSQLPPEEELGRNFDVSRDTIRSTLKKLENEGLIYRIRGKGTFVSPAVRKQKVLIGVVSVMPLQGHKALQILIAGAFVRAQEEHAQLQLISHEQLKETIETVKNNPALLAGLMFIRDSKINTDTIKLVEDAGIPFIVEGYAFPGCGYQDIDNYDAMKKLTEYLIGLGHRRYGLFMRDTVFHDHFEERRRGVIETLKNNGINEPRQVSLPDDTPLSEFYMMTEKFFRAKTAPTAIIAVSDNIAAEVIRWLHHHHYKVPEDVSVTGFDDLDFATYIDPPLTTIRQDVYSLSYMAADSVFQMMSNYMNRKIQRKVKLDLIIRQSSGPVKSLLKD